jgi:hypothetical protein
VERMKKPGMGGKAIMPGLVERVTRTALSNPQ